MFIDDRNKFLVQEINKVKAKILKVKAKRVYLLQEIFYIKKNSREIQEKLNISSTMPLLVATISEIIVKKRRKTILVGIILKTSNKLTLFVKNSGFLNLNYIQTNNLVAINRDNYFIVRRLPNQYDYRVKIMEVEEKPVQRYHDIGGLDNQIQELIEAIVFPIVQIEKFKNLGIYPPKGVLLYGPPGLGKTLLARACAAQTDATFLKIAASQLVQMYIGEGASLVREAFSLAKEKQPSIIFIDEIDAIGTKRSDTTTNGDREVQRTMLELLNQLDGFSELQDVKLIAATNRIDTLDPALLRSGRIDRKIEFPYPDQKSRKKILQIHTRMLRVSLTLDLDEIAFVSNGFNGSQLKAICIEAGMNAVRHGRKIIIQEDFIEALNYINIKRKNSMNYYC
ncbi:26S protease regulatory SU 6A (nucleomorph) [Cryptomonas paramecium]|uniref:26S protease regulatory SU 6A n=1 Tax=Cryptomonas paramaecium TaxID=2898 RepID=F2HHH1_9CRYP|nr:26S protease regulatory SU 6A [Cryptomonas paramecium]AEA38767.1 26S protease regulatory SU 6A [Cryptomonas paramecium]|mmetsp:Transcript_37242/g.99120  ORF Transcript_37242/g.99120 Transcript_37242/m.99120 type:complete len:396 (+) Transcript_37242:2437-3624(+)